MGQQQVNFRLDEETAARWAEIKGASDLKNDDLFAAALAAYSESRQAQGGGHQAELKEIQETLYTAVSQMVAVLGRDEARRKASVTAVQAERDELKTQLAKRDEAVDDARAQAEEAEGRAQALAEKLEAMTAERDALKTQLDAMKGQERDAATLAELMVKVDALAAAQSEGAHDDDHHRQ